MRDSKRRKHRNIDADNTEFFSPPPFVPAERTCLFTQKLTIQPHGTHPANPARRSVVRPAEASIFTNLKEQTQISGKICPNFGKFTNNTAERPNVPGFSLFQTTGKTARIKQSHTNVPNSWILTTISVFPAVRMPGCRIFSKTSNFHRIFFPAVT